MCNMAIDFVPIVAMKPISNCRIESLLKLVEDEEEEGRKEKKRLKPHHITVVIHFART